MGKNRILKYFEIMTKQRPRYDPLELLENRSRFREAMLEGFDAKLRWGKMEF